MLLLLTGGCTSARNVSVEPLGPRFPPTIWESIEVVPTADAVQRAFVPLGLLTAPESAPFLDESVVVRLQRAAAELGANAIVLEEVRSASSTIRSSPDAENAPAPGSGWSGVATAIRVVDGRWGDRYWRYGAPPGALEAAPGEPNARGVVRSEPTAGAADGEAAGPGWRRLISWSGSGVDRTDSFQVAAAEWRIVWQAAADEDGALEILVYGAADDLRARIDQAGMATGAYLGLAGEGAYYLQINGEDVSWTIAVDAWNPP